jgi:hypothetical protein
MKIFNFFDHYAYAYNKQEGFQILNIENPDDLQVTGFYDIPYLDDWRNYSPIVAKDNLALLSSLTHVGIYDCSHALGINEAPEWIGFPDSIKRLAGEQVEFQVAASDADDDPLTISMNPDGLPENASFTDIGDGTGNFTWQTNDHDMGLYNPEFIVSDGMDSLGMDVYIEIYSDSEIKVDSLPKLSSFAISSAYPNPFNGMVSIEYEIDREADIRLTIHDLQGRVVRELFRGHLSFGRYSSIWQAKDIPSGLYFIMLESGGRRQIKKVLLIN